MFLLQRQIHKNNRLKQNWFKWCKAEHVHAFLSMVPRNWHCNDQGHWVQGNSNLPTNTVMGNQLITNMHNNDLVFVMHLEFTDRTSYMAANLSDRCVLHSSIAPFLPQSFAHLFVIGKNHTRIKHIKTDANINYTKCNSLATAQASK